MPRQSEKVTDSEKKLFLYIGRRINEIAKTCNAMFKADGLINLRRIKTACNMPLSTAEVKHDRV